MKTRLLHAAIVLICGSFTFVSACHLQEDAPSQDPAVSRSDPLDSTKTVQTEISKQARQALGTMSAEDREGTTSLGADRDQSGALDLGPLDE